MIHNQYSKIKRNKEGKQILEGSVCFCLFQKAETALEKMQYQFSLEESWLKISVWNDAMANHENELGVHV